MTILSLASMLLTSLALLEPKQAPIDEPPASRGALLEERLGNDVARDIELVDHTGQTTTMDAVLDDGKPLVLVMAYYRCPMLCGLTVRGLAQTLHRADLSPDTFNVATVSFDPRDGPADAERARVNAMRVWGQPTRASSWPFFTTTESEARRLGESLGFHYVYDPKTEQYAHPAAIFVLSPDGKLTRYLHGLEFPPLDLRLALTEARREQVGSWVDEAVLTCFRYDPTTRRYGFYVFGFIRIAAALILIALVGGMIVLIRLDRKRSVHGRKTRQ